MSDDKKRLLRLRSEKNKKRPKFLRTEYHRLKRIQTTWRKPRGIDNKMRHKLKGKRKLPGTGYRNPTKVRGLHPSGFEIVHIHNLKELEAVDVETQVAMIGRTVGSRKRTQIIDKAEELGVHILNPRVRTFDAFEEIEEFEDDYDLLEDEEDVDLADALDDEEVESDE